MIEQLCLLLLLSVPRNRTDPICKEHP